MNNFLIISLSTFFLLFAGCSTQCVLHSKPYQQKTRLSNSDKELLKHLETKKLREIEISCFGLSSALDALNNSIQDTIGGQHRLSYVIVENRDTFMRMSNSWDKVEYKLKLKNASLRKIVDELAVKARVNWKISGNVIFYSDDKDLGK